MRTGERNESSKYELLVKLAVGGMGAVYVATGRGALGFESLVAVKRPHMHLLEGEDFKRALIEEARIASRIRHVNVVAVRDVAVEGALVYLVMDYVEGVSLAQMLWHDTARTGPLLPPDVAFQIALDACAGLHAAHEARGDDGRLLGVIHRDVSPHNILVGIDGVARLTDFGIAKCLTAAQSFTESGTVKGKLAYMAPEYLAGERIDRSTDVFALGIIVWEMLTGQHLFKGANQAQLVHKLVTMEIPRPSSRGAPTSAFDEPVMRALARDPKVRFATAAQLGEALEGAARKAALYPTHREVEKLVKKRFALELERRASAIRAARLEDGTIDISPSQLDPNARTPSAALPNLVSADGPPSEETEVDSSPTDPASTHPAPQAGVVKVERSTLKSSDWAAIESKIAEVMNASAESPLSATVPAVYAPTVAKPPPVATLPLGTPSPAASASIAHVHSAPTPRGVTGPTAFGKTADVPVAMPRRRDTWPALVAVLVVLVGGGTAAAFRLGVLPRPKPAPAAVTPIATDSAPAVAATSPASPALSAPVAPPASAPFPSPSLAISSAPAKPRTNHPARPPATTGSSTTNAPASASSKLTAPPNPYAQ